MMEMLAKAVAVILQSIHLHNVACQLYLNENGKKIKNKIGFLKV